MGPVWVDTPEALPVSRAREGALARRLDPGAAGISLFSVQEFVEFVVTLAMPIQSLINMMAQLQQKLEGWRAIALMATLAKLI